MDNFQNLLPKDYSDSKFQDSSNYDNDYRDDGNRN